MIGCFEENIHNAIDKDKLWQKYELPLKFLVLGNFSGTPEKSAIAEKKKIKVTKENINYIVSTLSPNISFSIPSLLKEKQNLAISLTLRNIKDFHPENIIKQVPELNRLIKIRKLIKNLKYEIKINEKFRAKLEEISQDKAYIKNLQLELNNIFSSNQSKEQ